MRAIVVGAAFGALAASTSAGGAQHIVPVPTPAACARPNVSASLIRAEPVDMPPMAQQQAIQGLMQLVVSLDADSRVVGVKVQSSPSAILNQAALNAARRSTYQTEIRDCRPIAADYVYTVYAGDKETLSALPPSARTVFLDARGTVTRAPDIAYVEARIVTHDAVAANAVAKDEAVFDALKAKLGALGIAESKIRRTEMPSGHQVEITIDTVANAGHVAAAAASVKSVDVLAIRYALNDRVSAFRDALSNALKDAEKGARDALTVEQMHLGVVKRVVVSPSYGVAPSTTVPFRLIPVAGGFKEPAIRIPDVEVHAFATVTYAVDS